MHVQSYDWCAQLVVGKGAIVTFYQIPGISEGVIIVHKYAKRHGLVLESNSTCQVQVLRVSRVHGLQRNIHYSEDPVQTCCEDCSVLDPLADI